MQLIILGNVPSKKNSKVMICRGPKPILLPSANYRLWHKSALTQVAGAKPIKKKSLTLTIYPDSRRSGDLTNKAESVMDLLVDAGLIEDDNWFIVSEILLKFGGVDKTNPRVEIEY